MSITAKEIASKLGLSATAVSMALNNKPGVSTETRTKIIRTAEEMGFDFSKIKEKPHEGSIYVISYKTSDAILSYSPIFDVLFDGIKSECQKNNYPIQPIPFYEKTDNLERLLEDIRVSDCCGIILIGTEITKDIVDKFIALNLPMVLTDTYFITSGCSSVRINNAQGAYLATDYLISIFRENPGHLQSSYRIPNFYERESGFNAAVRDNGMSPSRCIRHVLSPVIDDAMADMLEIIDSGVPLARAYFCDNDIIAIGAIKACRLRNIRIPEDIAFIGFDNINEGRIVEPALTTIDVPRFDEGVRAASTLIELVEKPVRHHSALLLNTKLCKRFSV